MTRKAHVLLTGFLAATFASRGVAAQQAGFAEPPDNPDRRRGPLPIAAPDDDRPRPEPSKPLKWGAKSDSVARFSLGPVLRADGGGAKAGLGSALEFGHGPAAFRLSGSWVRVGYDDPLQQYTGEIVLYLFDYNRFVGSVGAGAGMARVRKVDDKGAATTGTSTLGVGTGRLGLDFRIPLPDTDARAGIGASVVMPTMRGTGAPDTGTWAILGAGVTIGF